jgi:Na+/melibiose symporter-like transporter
MNTAAGTLRYGPSGLAGTMLWLLVGQVGIVLRERTVTPGALELLHRFGASDTCVSLLLGTTPAVLALALGPWIGAVSDRLRTRWGRRRPCLFIAAPLAMTALLLLAASGELGVSVAALLGSRSPGVPACQLAVFVCAWFVFSVAMVCVVPLYHGLVNDIMPPRWLGRFSGAFRAISLGIAIVFYLWLFEALDRYPQRVLATTAILLGASMLLMSCLVREGDYPPPAPGDASAGWWPATTGVLRDAARLPGAPWIFGTFVAGSMAFGPFNTFTQFYAAALGVGKADLGAWSAQSYAVSLVAAFGIGWLVDRHGAVRIALLASIAYAVVALAGWTLLLRHGRGFHLLFMVHTILSGAYFTATASLANVLFPRLHFMRLSACKDQLCALFGIVVSTVQGPLLDWSGHRYDLALLYAALCALACAACLARVAGSEKGYTLHQVPHT